MTDGLLIFLGGLLGSSHCVGMCGAFVLALGGRSPGRRLQAVQRQVVYALGRVFTYATAGAAAGFVGQRLALSLQTLLNIQGVLSVGAGILLVLQGLAATGLIRWGEKVLAPGGCPGAGFFAAWLGATRLHSVFLGGVVNGLLPCGLVYAYLTLAASSGDMFRGGAVMALFGFGTIPVLVLVGVSGAAFGLRWRAPVFRLAAWCVVLMGILALWRGVGVLEMGPTGEPACPHCHPGQASGMGSRGITPDVAEALW